MEIHNQRLLDLRNAMQRHGVTAFIVPSGDEFMNEYVPAYARRLEWLTGFSGSYGTAIILHDKAVFFTDGRYTLQAAQQLPKGKYQIFNVAEVKPHNWIKDNMNRQSLGLNPMLYTDSTIQKYQDGAQIVSEELIDLIWQDKPHKPDSEIFIHSVKYTGETHNKKMARILKKMESEEAEIFIITAPDSICWLLNIRGHDVPNTPLVLSRMILDSTGRGYLFVDSSENKKLQKHLGEKISIHPLNEINRHLRNYYRKRILVDKNTVPYSFYNELSRQNTVIEKADLCALPKACKNKTEIDGAILAHLRDGVAVTAFLHWLETNYKKKKLSEVSIAEALLELRRKDATFVEPSFDTIAGFASNGAIVHYHASDKSSKRISGNSLLLLDSGGQYSSGTTDITRTVAIGTPTKEQKRNFTLVLKGHIALATAVFPEGTSGHQLDILARQYLWQNGLDYDHGTGHGVGSFLGVHEGPQRISKAPNEVALMPGMIISNEPGYYKNGDYGIRIENLVVVEEAGFTKASKKFFRFKTITSVPIDPKLVDFSLLTMQEEIWLKDYHNSINKNLRNIRNLIPDSIKLSEKNLQWLGAIALTYSKFARN